METNKPDSPDSDSTPTQAELDAVESARAAGQDVDGVDPRPDPFLPVRRSDVAPYAKKKCKTCSGTGRLVVEMIGKDWAKREEKLCGCALKQFQKAATKGQIATRLVPIYASPEEQAEGKVKHYQLQWIPTLPPELAKVAARIMSTAERQSTEEPKP